MVTRYQIELAPPTPTPHTSSHTSQREVESVCALFEEMLTAAPLYRPSFRQLLTRPILAARPGPITYDMDPRQVSKELPPGSQLRTSPSADHAHAQAHAYAYSPDSSGGSGSVDIAYVSRLSSPPKQHQFARIYSGVQGFLGFLSAVFFRDSDLDSDNPTPSERTRPHSQPMPYR